MGLQELFHQWKKDCRLSEQEDAVLLAVSGGVDSMALLHLFRQAGFKVAVAHCNFQLRGLDSDLDEDLVVKTAAEWGIPCFIRRFDTRTYADTRGESIQMAARTLRYAWFVELAREQGFTHLATAHHLDDSVETALLNFLRGTGLAGLTGIRDARPVAEAAVPVLRPLLHATKSDILDYARGHAIPWREDASNSSDDYVRNALRHKIIPEFTALNPNFLRTAERNLQRLASANDNLLFLLRKYLEWPQPGEANGITLKKQLLMELPSPRHALRVTLQPYGFNEEQTRQVAANLQEPGLEIFSAEGWRLVSDREYVFVRRAEEENVYPAINIDADDLMVRLPDGKALFFTRVAAGAPFPDGKTEIVVPLEEIVYPLNVRKWQPGDAFQPFGMGGKSQKLQDYFTNLKLSRLEKDAIWVLTNGDGRIIWIIGWRLDERFRIASAGQTALRCLLQG